MEKKSKPVGLMTQFRIDCLRERLDANYARNQRQTKADLLRAEYGAQDVYIVNGKAEIWFAGPRPGARFFPNRNESLVVLPLS